jgi:transposase
MKDIAQLLKRQQLDAGAIRERIFRAPTPRERERWHALGLLAQGWTAAAVGEALERDPHTIGAWVTALRNAGPTALAFKQSGGPSPALDGNQQAQLKAAVQALPEKAGIDLANWNWKVVRRFVQERFGLSLSRSSCLNYLHRLGFVLKRPKKRLLKANEAQREAFVVAYAVLLAQAQQVEAKVFFADESHFRADADLRGKWVLKGEPALVDSTSPRWGEKASYYSAVCLETGEVEVMEIQGNSNAETSADFLKQLREKRTGPLTVIWDNAPAHHGDALRAYLATPGLGLRLVSLPAYSPDFNADEAIWDWAREEVTANLCLGTKAMAQEKLGSFFAQLAYRMEEVKQRCRTVLQALAEALPSTTQASSCHSTHVDSTLALV